MPFVIILAGALVVIAAFNNAQADLGKAIEQDLPGFFKWGAAIAAILALGYVPGLRTPSRWLLALVLLVLFLTNYQGILAGLKDFAGSGSASVGGGGVPTPASTFAATPDAGSAPTAAQVAGSSSDGNINAAGQGGSPIQLASSAASAASGGFNPMSLVSSISSIGSSIGFGGFG